MSDVVPTTRFEWTYPMSPPPAHLVMDVGGLTFTRGDHVQRVGLAEFSGGALHDDIVDAFDFPTLVEALALALPSSKALLEGGVPSDPLHRPKVVRVHGGGRGAAWVVFLLGRTVSGRALGEPFDLSFDDLLARGGTYRIARADLDDFLRGCEVAAAVPATAAPARLGPVFTHLDPDRLLSAWRRQGEPAAPPSGRSAPSSATSRAPSTRRSS